MQYQSKHVANQLQNSQVKTSRRGNGSLLKPKAQSNYSKQSIIDNYKKNVMWSAISTQPSRNRTNISVANIDQDKQKERKHYDTKKRSMTITPQSQMSHQAQKKPFSPNNMNHVTLNQFSGDQLMLAD